MVGSCALLFAESLSSLNNNNDNTALTATTNSIIDGTNSVGSSRQCLGRAVIHYLMTPAQVAAYWIQTNAPGLPQPEYPPEFGTLHTPLMQRLLKERDDERNDNRCSITDTDSTSYDPRDHIDEPHDNRWGYVDENDCCVRSEREEAKEEKKKEAEHHESGAPELTRKERDLERQSLPELTRRKVVHDCI